MLGLPPKAEIANAVRAERAAILALIEAQCANGHLYDGDYCLRNVAAEIRAREKIGG
jgi:hypothetical protein